MKTVREVLDDLRIHHYYERVYIYINDICIASAIPNDLIGILSIDCLNLLCTLDVDDDTNIYIEI